MAESITGVYWAPNRSDGKMRVEAAGDTLVVRIIAIKPDRADQVDIHNPDPSLRDQKLLGSIIMHDFSYDADTEEWVDGEIYDCKSGKRYSGRIWLDADGNLQARGYLLLSLFGRTEMFERVEGPAPETQQAGEPELVHLSDDD